MSTFTIQNFIPENRIKRVTDEVEVKQMLKTGNILISGEAWIKMMNLDFVTSFVSGHFGQLKMFEAALIYFSAVEEELGIK